MGVPCSVLVLVRVEAPVRVWVAAAAVGNLPLVPVCPFLFAERLLAVATLAAVSVYIVERDHDVLLEGGAAALYVEV